MYSISEIKKSARFLPHKIENRLAAVKMLRNSPRGSIASICRKYHISRKSLWRWNNLYDGTKDSLIDKSHRPLSKHPNSHSNNEIRHIRNYCKRNPNISLCELWYKLKLNKGYTRNITSLYRVLKRLNIKYNKSEKQVKKYVPKPYHTPANIGEKWQIDVKFVPDNCKSSNLPVDLHFYQYTCIDEASRERYIYHYFEQTAESTVDFVQRCIKYFGYKPKIIQTDNGMEFCFFRDVKKIHPLDKLCNTLNIAHKRIKPRTPRHNGKVERSHRNDQERFYNNLKFYSMEDLHIQASRYLKRSNNIPMSVLNYLTPKEMRNKLCLSA